MVRIGTCMSTALVFNSVFVMDLERCSFKKTHYETKRERDKGSLGCKVANFM